jgi:hypothetical protein
VVALEGKILSEDEVFLLSIREYVEVYEFVLGADVALRFVVIDFLL